VNVLSKDLHVSNSMMFTIKEDERQKVHAAKNIDPETFNEFKLNAYGISGWSRAKLPPTSTIS